MNDILKRLGIVALVAAIGFSLSGCPASVEPGATTGSVTGNVVFPDGADGITLTIELETIDGLLAASVDVTDQSPAGGSFRFDGLDPGTYTLYVSSRVPLGRSQVRTLTVTAGGVYSLGTLSINLGCDCGAIPSPCGCTHGNVGCGCDLDDLGCGCTNGGAGCTCIPDNFCNCDNGAGSSCGCDLENLGCNCDNGTGTVPGCGCDPAVATGITLYPNALPYLNLGDTYLLFATVTPVSAANQTVIWLSSNPEVVSITESMVPHPRFGISGPQSAVRIRANSWGTATITAAVMASGGVEHWASLTVTVAINVAGDIIFDLANDEAFQALPLGPIIDAVAAFYGTPLQAAGATGAHVRLEVVERDGRNALLVGQLGNSWSGVDVMDWFVEFDAGDLFVLEGEVLAGPAQLFPSVNNGGWGSLIPGGEPVLETGDTFVWIHIITPSDAANIRNNSPAGIRIRANNDGSLWVISELRIVGGRPSGWTPPPPPPPPPPCGCHHYLCGCGTACDCDDCLVGECGCIR